MIRKEIDVSEFEKIAKEHEYFIWNFITKDSQIAIRPFFEPEDYTSPNPLKSLLESVSIPYFETDLKTNYDFVMNLGDIFLKNVYKNCYTW